MQDDTLLLVYTFDSARQAREAKDAVLDLTRRLGGPQSHVAVVQKRPDGRITLREPGDLREELSEIAATVVGGAAWFVYTFAGMLGPQSATLAGEAANRAVHRLVRDTGFPDQALYEIGQELEAGSAALVALVPVQERDATVQELERLGGRLWEHPLPASVVAELRQAEGQG
ncbi:MAG: DUF1269 domain-containing protein [Chloroflexaceae bacterium]|nr:DUF1269 domain-containing protein [Chloroflexaceae bacterium]